MISALALRNFKRFHASQFTLRPLTVLSGLNGTGKSTAIQAVLLARQAAEDDGRVVQLNDRYGLSLGEALDVLYHDADEQVIDVRVTADDQMHRFRFEVPDERALHLRVVERPTAPPRPLTGRGFAFTYLTAERLGPRDTLSVTSEDQAQVGIGEQGQYTAQSLALHETHNVREPLLHPRTGDHGVTTLRTQVEEWASEIIRPIRISAYWPAGITASVIRFETPGLVTDPIRPTNMGFGVSYALPVVVAGLLAPPGGLLIVENPEAHLHPAGQSRLGRFLARVAGGGAQVIVETHSDHVLNGIRLAAIEDRVIPAAEVIVHFFGEDDGGDPTPIALTSRGGLTSWPPGFFDQIEEDLGRLTRAKRRDR